MLSILNLYKHPRGYMYKLIKQISPLFSDKLYVEIVYYLKMGKKLNLKRPKTFNEKIQWLKLYNRRPKYTTMVDKYAVKEYVSNIIGSQYIIPTLGVWDIPEQINWESLPKQFVLKTTHGGGNTGVLVCKDKDELNKEDAIDKMKVSLKEDIYCTLREWPYKNVPRRIIAEEYMEDSILGELRDYKFFCFNGEVKVLFVATERSTGNVKFDFFDSEFNHLDIMQVHPMSGKTIAKPKSFEQMKKIAKQLSIGIPFVRIDLYEVNGRVYFGEYTFYHHGGIVPFHPEEWDFKLGSWISLSVV